MELVLRTSKRLAMMAVVVLLLVRPGVALEKVSGNKRVLDTQFGDATFYAARFEGRKTASGQIYEGDRAIAAHRTYPFGTVVRVTCLRNQRSANVVIVDRGP